MGALVAKKKPAAQPKVEEPRPDTEAAKPPPPVAEETTPPVRADPLHVTHLRCRESTQIGPFGSSLDEERSQKEHELQMSLDPELQCVEVLLTLKGQHKRYVVPLSMVAHLEMEDLP